VNVQQKSLKINSPAKNSLAGVFSFKFSSKLPIKLVIDHKRAQWSAGAPGSKSIAWNYLFV